MKTWIINHYGGPPGSGRFERPVYMAEAFVRDGHKATVWYAGFHHLLGTENVTEETLIDEADGVSYIGVKCRRYDGNGISRVLNMFDFSRQARKIAAKLDPPDLVIASSPHPFVLDFAFYLKKQYGTKIIFEIRDLWPESLVELAGVSSFHPFVLLLEHKVRKGCQNADAVVSLLPHTLGNLEKKGLTKDRFHWIPNGVDVDLHTKKLENSIPDIHLEAISEARDRKRFLIGYAGAMGPPNALNQLVELVNEWDSKSAPVQFLLVGEGCEKERLCEILESKGCDYIRFLPGIKKAEVPTFLSAMDASIILWQDTPIYRFGVSPNKVSEYMLSKKPVIWAGDTANDPVAEAECGISISPNDRKQLKKAIVEFISLSETKRRELGESGYRYACENLNWKILGEQYVSLAESLINES